MDETYKYLISDMRQALAARHLCAALDSLQGAATCLKEATVADEAAQIRASYGMMLDYFEKGVDDPERARLYHRFLQRCMELGETLGRVGELQSDSHYATTRRMVQRLVGDDSSLLSVESLSALEHRNLFDLVLTSSQLLMAEHELLSDYLWHDDDLLERKCLVASALTLGCLKYFDAHKLRLLIALSEHPEPSLQVRGLVGTVFVCACHADKVAYYPDVESRLSLLLDQGPWAQKLDELQAQLFLTLDTKRIDRKINEEIVPKIMEHIKEVRKERDLSLDDFNPDLMDSDINPDWQRRTGAAMDGYFKEFVAWQEKGADLYMNSFSHLKQRFPFFSYAANWFYPFTFNHPSVPESCRTNPMIGMMFKSNALCDSDKYSFCLMTETLSGTTNMDKVMSHMPEEVKVNLQSSMNEVLDADFSKEDFKQQLRSYVQGFYRFCNLFSFHCDYPDPFKCNLLIGEIHPFESLLANSDAVLRLADAVFDEHSYSLASHLYAKLPADKCNGQTWQKMGFCEESLKRYDAAVECYEKALHADPNSTWTLRRITSCLRRLRKYAEAELHLLELEQLQPEETDVTLWLAECFMHEQLYDEAFKRLFKVDYLQPGRPKVQRALGWCSLLTGKYEQAEKYYERLLADEEHRTSADYLNAGHVAWLMGLMPETISRYKEAAQTSEAPYDFLAEDKPILLRAGKTEAEITMMADAIGRSVQQKR